MAAPATPKEYKFTKPPFAEEVTKGLGKWLLRCKISSKKRGGPPFKKSVVSTATKYALPAWDSQADAEA